MGSLIAEKEEFAALLLRLRAVGIDDPHLLSAFEAVSRSFFIPPAYRNDVYGDRVIPIDCGGFAESIDQLVALFQHLNVAPHHRILDVGTGSGYSSAVLSYLGARVVTMDRYRGLVNMASQKFSHIGRDNIVVQLADGLKGPEGEGVFDRIYVSASFPQIPRHYVDFLTTEGIMVAPLVLEDGTTRFVKLSKVGNRFEREDIGPAYHAPLIKGLAAAI